jgi:hypothetical protein
MKKIIAIIGMILIIACSATRVVLDHGSVRHDTYFIDYEVTKLENDHIEVYAMLRELNRAVVVYRDTINTDDYLLKLSELYTKALYKIDTLRGKYE